MTALLAIAGAAFYGSADFLGGLASRRESPLAVTILSQVFGVLLLFALVFLFPGSGPASTDLLWGGAGGVAGALGIVALYTALATGPMSLVAPVTASLAAALPALWDLVANGSPGPVTLAGLALAFAAIVTISAPDAKAARRDRMSPAVLALSIGAGVAFGAFFVLLSYTSPDSGMWPLVGARATSLPVLLLIALVRRQGLRVGPGARVTTLAAGGLDMIANALVLAALQLGPLAVAAVLSALYPAATTVLAWFVLEERPDARHKIGIAMALVAVVLTAAP